MELGYEDTSTEVYTVDSQVGRACDMHFWLLVSYGNDRSTEVQAWPRALHEEGQDPANTGRQLAVTGVLCHPSRSPFHPSTPTVLTRNPLPPALCLRCRSTLFRAAWWCKSPASCSGPAAPSAPLCRCVCPVCGADCWLS